MRYIVIFILIISTATKSYCCLNEYRTLLGGEVVFTDAEHLVPSPRYNKVELLEKLNHAYNAYKSSRNLTDYSDYGVALAFNGEFQKANAIFLEIEKKTPNLYETASNIGTTYELLGQIDSAIYWLNKAIKINPLSHNGSEWIHLKILEAKKATNGNQQMLSKMDILSLGLGENLLPENKENIDLDAVKKQIYSQLHERMSLIQPKDPVIARLLFDLGNVTAISDNLEETLLIYEKAREYGYTSETFNRRESHFKDLTFKANFRNNTELWAKKHFGKILLVSGILLIIGIIWSAISRKNQI
jgi:tetratricopeptide (TPR) repeat protein